jgi:hypothetical protein
MKPSWTLGPGAVAAGRDITGTVIAGPVTVQVVAGSFDRLRDAIFDPTELVEQLDLARFEGRRELIGEIDARISSQDRGYVVIRGEAGVGKSALAAHLVWNRPCVYHFTRLDGGARLPVEARKSLAAQLIGGWGLADRFTPDDVFPAAAQRPDWLAKVIRAAAGERDRHCAGQPLVLVVDGLDEAEADLPGMDTGVPLGLPAPQALPGGVFIIATSRYGLPLAALRDPARVGWSQITVEGPQNLNDMRTYLDTAVAGPNPDRDLLQALDRHRAPAGAFVNTLMNRCHGVWIYLRYVLDEIRSGDRRPDDVASLPDRLRGYYLLQIDRWTRDEQQWRQLRRPVLAVLAALQRPATAVELAEIISASSERVMVDQVGSWLDGPARAFLDVSRTVDRRRTYRVRHQSLRDLLTADPSTHHPDEDDEPDAGMGEQLRNAWLWAHTAITKWLTPSSVDGRRDWTGCDEYTRLMLPEHAADGGVLDALLTDPEFLLACPHWSILRGRATLRTPEGAAAANALEAASNEWVARPGDDPSWWLHVWACKTRATVLAQGLADQTPEWPWTIDAAFWSGTTHRTLTGHTGEVSSVAVLPRPDGQTLIISGGADGTVRVWDPDTGRQLGPTLTGHTGEVSSVAALPRPDGRTLIISGGDDGAVLVWASTQAFTFTSENGASRN